MASRHIRWLLSRTLLYVVEYQNGVNAHDAERMTRVYLGRARKFNALGNLAVVHRARPRALSVNAQTSQCSWLGELKYLRALSLTALSPNRLPESIRGLTILLVLEASGIQLCELTSVIGELTQLRSLCLSFNFLTRLPPEIGNLQRLTHLDLSHNVMMYLPEEIVNLQALERRRSVQQHRRGGAR